MVGFVDAENSPNVPYAYTPRVHEREDRVSISRSDLRRMRTIFSNASIANPRHCFRWNNNLSRWELSEVAPANRTLIAFEDDAGWTVV